MAKNSKKDFSNIRKKQKIFFGLLAVLVILIIGLIYFLLTGKKPVNVIPAPDFGKPTYLFSIYADSNGKRLNKPLGVAVNNKENAVYISDSRNSRIVVFDFEGKFLFQFKKIKKGVLRNPGYLAVNPKNNTIFVSDTGYLAIFIFDKRGKFLKKFIPNNNKKFPWVPLGMVFDNKGNLYVADKGLHRIVTFNSQGKRLLSIGKKGQVKNLDEKPGYLYFPNRVEVAKNGDIYVSDSNNQRIQIFNKDGKFKSMIAVKGLPRGIGLVKGGSSAGIYVVNLFDHQVQVFNQKGKALFTFGERGQGEGEFRYPNDIAISANKIFITDKENDRVQVWRF